MTRGEQIIVPEACSVTQIAGFLAAENYVQHGVDAQTTEQNSGLFEELADVAERSPSIINLSVVGSRRNGYADRRSDLDLVVVTFGTGLSEEEQSALIKVGERRNIKTDLRNAATVLNLSTRTPSDPSAFVEWVRQYQENAAALFDEGIYRHPALPVYRFAAASVIMADSNEGEPFINWEALRTHQMYAYLGNLERIREKLVERLGAASAEHVALNITADLLRQRYEKFAQPRFIQKLHQQMQDNHNAAMAAGHYTADDPAVLFLHGVLRELGAVKSAPYVLKPGDAQAA